MKVGQNPPFPEGEKAQNLLWQTEGHHKSTETDSSSQQFRGTFGVQTAVNVRRGRIGTSRNTRRKLARQLINSFGREGHPMKDPQACFPSENFGRKACQCTGDASISTFELNQFEDTWVDGGIYLCVWGKRRSMWVKNLGRSQNILKKKNKFSDTEMYRLNCGLSKLHPLIVSNVS